MAQKKQKKYRSFHTMDELNAAQEEIKRKYQDLEDNALSNLFDPVQIGLAIIPRLFKSTKSYSNQANTNTLKSNVTTFNNDKLHILSPKKNKTSSKKIIGTIIRWQIIGLAVWGAKKLIDKRRNTLKTTIETNKNS